MAIDGDTAIVGVLGGRGNERFSGAAYVYGRHEGGVNNRGEVAKITASNGAVFDEFAQSVAISGDTAIVGVCWNCDGGYVYFETQVCLDDAECGDGDACNGAETCDTETGECFPGTPIECDDGDECNGVELCDPQTGDCLDGAFGDCNGIDDACELASCGSDPGCDDCDGNGSLDRCDIASGQPDVNGNGVLDQ